MFLLLFFSISIVSLHLSISTHQSSFLLHNQIHEHHFMRLPLLQRWHLITHYLEYWLGNLQQAPPPPPPTYYNASKSYVALIYGDMDNMDFVRTFGRFIVMALYDSYFHFVHGYCLTKQLFWNYLLKLSSNFPTLCFLTIAIVADIIHKWLIHT